MVDEIRATQATLLLDSGNALFAVADTDDPVAHQRASLLLTAMARLHTAAMAVGMRDLSAGLEFLRTEAKRAQLPVLSANLTLKGNRAFEPSTVTTVGGLKVGIVAISPVGPFPKVPGMVGQPPVPAAIAEAKKLRARKVDLVVVLAAVPFADALQLSREAGDAVDVILQSSDSRAGPVVSNSGDPPVYSSGERGRSLQRFDLYLDGAGRFLDLTEIARARDRSKLLDRQIETTRQRASSGAGDSPAEKKALQDTLENFEKQQATVKEQIQRLEKVGGRRIATQTVPLGDAVADDPGLKAQVDKLQPPAHP